MLGVIIYYVVFGAIAIALGVMLFKLWDQRQSKHVVAAMTDPAWLEVDPTPPRRKQQF